MKFKTEKSDFIVITISGIFLVLFLIPLISDDAFQMIFGSSENRERVSIAQIIEFKNSNRVKRADTFSWDYVTSKTYISKGDSLYTGADSFSQVELNTGGTLHLGPYSLVKFMDVDQFSVPHLTEGEFDLEIKGNMKVLLKGKVFDFNSSDSKVRVQIKENKKVELKVLQGELNLKNETGQSLQISSSEDHQNKTLDIFLKENLNSDKTEILAEMITAKALDKNLSYFWQIDDFYLKEKKELRKLYEPRSFVPSSVYFKTDSPLTEQSLYFKISQNKDFETSSVFKLSTDSASVFSIPQTYLGNNFYQTSLDGKTWSPSSQFFVKFGEYKLSPPQFKMVTEAKSVGDYQQVWRIQLQAQSDQKEDQYLIEISNDSSFLPEKTKIFQVDSNGLSFQTDKPLDFFARSRRITENKWISDYSETEHLSLNSSQFLVPTILAGPSKSKQPRNIASNSSLSLKKSDPSSNRTALVSKNLIQAKPSSSGESESQLESIPETKSYGESATLASPLPTADEIFYNSKFHHSKVSFSFGNLNLLSIDQIDQEKSPPSLVMSSLSLSHWSDAHGFDLSLQSKVATVQKGVDQPQSPLKAELKYAHRWILNSNFLSPLKKFQLSWILGAEYYRNPSQDFFSKQYDLIKSGIGLHFPAFRRWDTGGELLYGVGMDQSKKYEISGFLGYYLSMNKTIGLGYRIYLFDAGSLSSSSSFGFPYKEGAVEGSTYFRWTY